LDLPDLVLVLIVVAIVLSVLVGFAMKRRRNHALRDRFAEEYNRVLHEHGRRRR
jgi:hypothetical protein